MQMNDRVGRQTAGYFCAARAAFVSIVLLTALLAAACEGPATGYTPNTGIIGPTGNGSGGGSGGAVAGTYALVTVNGDALPDTLANDSIVTSDSTHILRMTLDSSYIVLHGDTTANLYNYLTVHEQLTYPANPSADFTAFNSVIGDTLPSTYVYNSTTASVTLTTTTTATDSGGIVPIGSFALSFAPDTLAGSLSYNVSDLLGTFVEANTSAFVYVNNGTGPATDRLPPHVITTARRY
jgi:hypothetical protein